MGETSWQRLRRLTEERRAVLGLTQAQVEQAGGPTPRWFQNLSWQEGEPTPRMRTPMAKADKALRWQHGTSWRIASGEITEPVERDELAQELEQLLAALPAPDRQRMATEVRLLLDVWWPKAGRG